MSIDTEAQGELWVADELPEGCEREALATEEEDALDDAIAVLVAQ